MRAQILPCPPSPCKACHTGYSILTEVLFNLLSTFYYNYVAVDIYVFIFVMKALLLFMWLMCINIWEEIPTNIKRFSYQFKKQYKRILLNSQSNYV